MYSPYHVVYFQNKTLGYTWSSPTFIPVFNDLYDLILFAVLSFEDLLRKRKRKRKKDKKQRERKWEKKGRRREENGKEEEYFCWK